ncbi:CCDC90 family protein [Pararhodospirillum oryzae]|uniref:DUF1640 domain-containing protein n=1 Tax=Pararhodospirillum oryzae TaxID=478448 RepID=A0A512H985_9PROT|nr:hypothetical protein [Pararhodospirillum oryzae]GEO82004.1 hypothetical protein ROR02_21350 [Pararhodospirillum oryzae]
MNALPFALDTHAFIKKMVGAGMTEAQAEAVTDLVREAQGAAIGELATKTDLAALRADLAAQRSELMGEISTVRSDLSGEIAALRSEVKAVEAGLRAEINAAKSDTTRWMVGTVLVAVLLNGVMVLGAMVGLAKLLGS